MILNSAWGNISVGRCCGGSCCNSRGFMEPPGSPFQAPELAPQPPPLRSHKPLQRVCQSSPHSLPPCGPINRSRGYARLDWCVGFWCPWQSFSWVITNRSWTYAFHTYEVRLWNLSRLIKIEDGGKVCDPKMRIWRAAGIPHFPCCNLLYFFFLNKGLFVVFLFNIERTLLKHLIEGVSCSIKTFNSQWSLLGFSSHAK